MIKRFLIAIVLLALVGGGIVGFNMFRDQAIQDFFANMPTPTATVSTMTVEPRSWTPNIEAIGTVRAINGVDLAVETAGVVREIRFQSNQKVEQGDILVQLDDAVEQANLAAQQTQAALDRQTATRAQELQERGVNSSVTLESAQAAADASAAQVESLQAVVEQKRLRAPFSGTVGISRIDIGQYLQPGTVVTTLQNVDTMRADFTVPEQRLSQLRIDQPIVVALDGQSGEFKGRITGIDPKVDPASRLVSVRAEIENPENVLTPGQFARIAVQLPQEDNVLTVPQTAVVTSLYGDYVYAVWPMEQQQQQAEAEAKSGDQAQAAEAAGQPATPPASEVARQVFVKVGRRDGMDAEILEGLKAGDVVVTAGQNRLSNNSPLKIDNTIDPSKPAPPSSGANDDTQDGSVDAGNTGASGG